MKISKGITTSQYDHLIASSNELIRLYNKVIHTTLLSILEDHDKYIIFNGRINKKLDVLDAIKITLQTQSTIKVIEHLNLIKFKTIISKGRTFCIIFFANTFRLNFH